MSHTDTQGLTGAPIGTLTMASMLTDSKNRQYQRQKQHRQPKQLEQQFKTSQPKPLFHQTISDSIAKPFLKAGELVRKNNIKTKPCFTCN
jgi:hypothetical protein